jgi:hypothetical protein
LSCNIDETRHENNVTINYGFGQPFIWLNNLRV